MLQSLEDNDLDGFSNYISAAQEANADLNHQYGAESGFKTILHLALEEDDGLSYVEELLKVKAILTAMHFELVNRNQFLLLHVLCLYLLFDFSFKGSSINYFWLTE